MSKPDKQTHRDFSIFDTMRTEELEEILFQDSQLPEEASDVSAILYIADVLAKRKENRPDVDAAWASFREHYLPDADGVSLYEDEEDSAADKPERRKPCAGKKHGMFFRAATTAAVVVLVLFVGSLTAYAKGFDLWSAVANWTKETFGFVTTSAMPTETSLLDEEGKDELQLALDHDGVTEVTAPTYIPEGYRFSTFTKNDLQGKKTYTIVYATRPDPAEKQIMISFCETPGGQFEKDAENPEIYECNGTQYYIMTNMGNYLAVWRTESYECSIFGVPTREELIRMIDSMEEAK